MMKPTPDQNDFFSGKRAFSLLEILVVMAIVVVLASAATLSIAPTLRAQKLSPASAIVADELLMYRQKAISINAPVLVRFFKQQGHFSAFQSYVAEGGSWVPSSKLVSVGDAVVIHPSPVFSSLPISASLGDATKPEIPPTLKGLVQEIREFQFQPDGSINLDPNSVWCLTLVSASPTPDITKLPPNFTTIQIEKQSGRIKAYRP